MTALSGGGVFYKAFSRGRSSKITSSIFSTGLSSGAISGALGCPVFAVQYEQVALVLLDL